MRNKEIPGKINKSDQIISTKKSASPLLSSCSKRHLHIIPVKPSTHFLVSSIPKENISKIQQLYWDSATFHDSHITSYMNVKNPYVTLSSFHSLLTYGEPIDDSIFYSFFKLLRVTCPDCHTVDTNFHRLFMPHGWETAYRKFFIHAQSSNYSKKSNSKPSLNSATILIPIHIQGCHWVALVHRTIAGRVFFMYSGDMNSINTTETIRMKYASQTSDSFHPHDSIWINCNNFTYFPHSNECSPRTIPALTVLACHPSPSPNILLPFMDDNIAQLSRWWIAASSVGNCVDIVTLQDKFPQICENSDLS
jgi:hypothetical protein